MGEIRNRVYRATLLCPGLDGDVECGPVREGRCYDEGQSRRYVFDEYVCPVCGRTEGFTVQANEEVVE